MRIFNYIIVLQSQSDLSHDDDDDDDTEAITAQGDI